MRNSNSFKKTIDVIISFKESNKELSISEIIEMINIIGENGQVFGVLRPWKDGKFPNNKKVREFISEYVDILSEDRESLDEYTINNLNKVFNAIYLCYLRADNEKVDIYLYHTNSVITSRGFILINKLF